MEQLLGNYVLVIPEPFAPPSPATDPIYQFRTSRTVYLYERDPVKSAVTRRVAVHFGADDRVSALHSARLIARLLRLHRERFGRETTFRRTAREVNVWFVPTPATAAHAGGETRDANLYVFAASRIVSPVELVRTVAHEWGHQTLPAARGYSEPENDAAGYLGERLFLTWVLADTANRYPDDDAALTMSLVSYKARQVTPLVERWQEGGPENVTLSGDRTLAMDYYIGAVLDSDRAFGSRVMGDALFTIADTGAQDFIAALSDSLDRHLESGLTVRFPTWIALKPGAYQAMSREGVMNLEATKLIRVPFQEARSNPAKKSPPVSAGVKRGAVRASPGEGVKGGAFRVRTTDWYRATVTGAPQMPSASLKRVPDKRRIATE